MSITKIERLRRRAVLAQENARLAHLFFEGKMDINCRPRSHKAADQAYIAVCYAWARTTFKEYQRATQ